MTIDTRNLIVKRDELKQYVLNSFLETFEHYANQTKIFEDIRFEEEEIQSWKEDWYTELADINEIDTIEDIVGSEFNYGCTLIDEKDFIEYVEELLTDCGYIPKDFPNWIEIDWESTADNVKIDYSKLKYQSTTYLFRM